MAQGSIYKKVSINDFLEVRSIDLATTQQSVEGNATKWFAVPIPSGYQMMGFVGYQLDYGAPFHIYILTGTSVAIYNTSTVTKTFNRLTVNVLLKKQ